MQAAVCHPSPSLARKGDPFRCAALLRQREREREREIGESSLGYESKYIYIRFYINACDRRNAENKKKR